jgi:hypothetical protein
MASRDALVIVASWSILVVTMLTLGGLGFDFGFAVWPFGETRNWVEFLQDGQGSAAAKLFWKVDNRNALAPWLYIPLRSLIARFEPIFLILHLLAGLLVGVLAYFTIREVTQQRDRLFALSCGILISLFIVNGYRDGIVWTQLVALGCTLAAIWSFARFLNTDRISYGFFGLSIVAWLMAIGIYTLQCGAVGVIVVLSFLQSVRGKTLAPGLVIRGVGRALLDAVPYLAVLAIYLMIWRTTSAVGVPEEWSLRLSFGQFMASVLEGIWHTDYKYFLVWVKAGGGALMFAVFAIASVGLWVLFYFSRAEHDARSIPISGRDLALVGLIALCVVAPTVILEAASDMWTPGTRWRMLMQFSTPLLFCMISAALLAALPIARGSKLNFWRLEIAVAGGCAILLALGFNHSQVVYTKSEKQFFADLTREIAHDRQRSAQFPRTYIVKAEVPNLYYGNRMSDVYARTLLGADVTLRFVPPLRVPYEEKKMAFATDGVENVSANRPRIPYDQITVLLWDGVRMTRQPIVDKYTFDGYHIDWRRASALPLPAS